jgi:hypothetical protein
MFFVVGLELAVLLVVFLGCVLCLVVNKVLIHHQKKKPTYCDV